MIINKTFPPNKLINEPYGTIHSIDGDHGKELYVQVSQDKENPHWISMGDFLVKALESEINNPEFMDSCLFRYQESNPK